MSLNYLLRSKILISDRPDNFARLRQAFCGFRKDHFTIDQTDSPAELLTAIQADEHDIYLVNWKIVKNFGWELFKELERRGRLQTLILLIGEKDQRKNRKAFGRFAVNCLDPERFSPEVLENVVDRALAITKNETGAVRQASKYRNLIESLPVMFYAVESVKPYAPLYISPAFSSLGYPLEKWRNRKDMWVRLLHPEDREWVLRETEKAMQEERATDYKYRLIARDGSVRWIHDQGCFARDAAGQTICWQGVMIDVTEHMKAEELLRGSEERYRQMFEGNQSIQLLVDAETTSIVSANPAACRFYGYSIEDFKTKKISDLNILSEEEIGREIEKARKGLCNHFNFSHRLASGEVRDVEVHSSLLKTGGKNLLYSIIHDITERKKAEDALRESEERFRELFDNASDLVYMHDLEGNYLSINRAGERVFGYTREESLKMNLREVVAPDHLELARQQIAGKLVSSKKSIYEIDCIAKDGRRISLEINSRLVYHNGEAIAIQGIARDITERKRTEDALKESEERFRDLFENANDLIYTHDLEGNFTSLNRAGERITGYAREEAIKMNVSQIVAPEYLEQAREMIAQKLDRGTSTAYELEIVTKYGHRVTLELSTRLIYQKGDPVGVQGIGRDITERKRVEEKLQYNALYDPLTNLPNRTHFMKHLGLAVERAEKESRFRFAVLFLDLDRFKLINDSLGHAVGDKLLLAIAEKLKTCVRPSDIIARLGGDEFTLLLTIKEERDAVLVAERIKQTLTVPFKLDNYEVFTSASVGIVISSDIRRTPEEVLRDADAAMYQAKETGKARYEIFDYEMHVRNINLLQLETDLRRALEREEFEVCYQPIVDLETGRICEFEALIRWNHPEQGLVMPNDFIPVSEETGLIIPIGEWILRESCRQIKQWQNIYEGEEKLSISVNLSAKQLMHPLLTAQVRQILDEIDLAPELLKLEVTESMVMEHSETAESVLMDLNDYGVQLSTDDFGTGYSSLSYLHRFPFDRLKIDRSFIMKMDRDLKTEAIVRTILMLGQNLEIEVTAEGIENEQQLWQLRSLGCRRGQGYLFSKPVDARTAEELLIGGLPVDFLLMEEPFNFSNVNSDPLVQLDKLQ
ncbi:MAG: PAS domain S-box protein [Pyrinomonadaceae bacterium]